jgi:primosomal protein N''
VNVTVAVLAGPDRRRARSLVAHLGPSLVPGDNLVILRPGEDFRSPRTWRVAQRPRIVRPSTLPRTHEVVLVLDERAEPCGPWLDVLLETLEVPGVGGCAPRTNIAAGDELLVGVPYRPKERAVRHAFVSSLAARLGAQALDARIVSGPCMAVRRELLQAAGGLGALDHPHPLAALSSAVTSFGHRVVVAAGSYLHNGGGPPPRRGPRPPGVRPLVSACLIVKDEHDNLGRCLASLERFCDEVVVYDTGSTDDTREIARAAGALVVEGDWDGDFARARNAALDHCSGEWVLWIDADEALVTDDSAQRAALENASAEIEAFIVTIDNLRGAYASTTFAHPACRLFRRAYGCWTGKLHEQVIARAGAPKLEMVPTEGIRLTHWGYLTADFESRDKAQRNLTSSFSDLTSSSGLSWPSRLVNLARSYGLRACHEEAVDLARAAIAAGTTRAVERLALRTIIGALLGLDRGEDALGTADELRAISKVPLLADLLTGRALVSLGRDEEALEALARVQPGVDDDGFEYDSHDVAVPKATALSRLGRHSEAADVLLRTITEHGGLDVHVGTLVQCLDDARRPLDEIARAVPEDRAVAFLGQLLQLEADVADRVLEAWHARAPSTAVLATAARVAAGLPLERRAVWSDRLRAAGFAHACPLVKVSESLEQALAGAALAAHRDGDARGRMAVTALAQYLAPGELEQTRHEVGRRAPSVIALFDAVVQLASLEPEGPRCDEPSGAPSGACKKVLVVAATVSIRAMALAVSLRRCGHAVTLVQPAARGARQLLGPQGVDVAAFGDEGCEVKVATICASRPFDAVVVTGHGPRAELRQLLPAASVVVDLDDAPEPAPSADLVLAMWPGAGLAGVPASAPHLYPPPRPFPLERRGGLCVAGDFAAATPEELAHLEGAVLPALSRRLDGAPVAVVGTGGVARMLPGALDAGTLANPLPWLRAARVVLVGCRSGAEHWLAAAQLCGTPALAVPGAEVEELAQAVAALCDRRMDELWARMAPEPPTEPAEALSDPLLELSSRERALAAGSPWSAPGICLFETGGVTVADLRWGYGALPMEWLGPIRDLVDEVRVPTAWAQEQTVASGVSADKVHVVGVEVDTAQYSPVGPRRALSTRKDTKLLYVGDCSARSGIDALIEAFFIAFGAHDRVCLVVGATADATRSPIFSEVQKATSSSGHPEVLLVDAGASPSDRAALYRACDALVCPERAQGDPAILLEAMACGLPVVLLEGGGFEELCGPEEGYVVAARAREVAPREAGVIAAAGRMWQLEPRRAALCAALRAAAEDQEGGRRRGSAARRRVLERALVRADT